MQDALQDPNSKGVVFNFFRDSVEEGWRISTIDFQHPSHIYRMYIPTKPGLRKALVGEFCDQIEPLLVTGDEPHLTSMTDKALELPGLILTKLRVYSNTKSDGRETIILRCALVVGNMQAMLLVDYRSLDSKRGDYEQLTTRVVGDLVRPILDILAYIETDSLTDETSLRVMERLKALSEERDELMFLTHLLQRAIDEPTPRVAEPLQVNDGSREYMASQLPR